MLRLFRGSALIIRRDYRDNINYHGGYHQARQIGSKYMTMPYRFRKILARGIFLENAVMYPCTRFSRYYCLQVNMEIIQSCLNVFLWVTEISLNYLLTPAEQQCQSKNIAELIEALIGFQR